MLRHGILGLLNYSDMTGYELMEVFRDSLNYFWTVQTSQLYRELQTMNELGWIDGTLVEQTGKPDKKVFSITGEGRAELLRWLTEYHKPGPVRDRLLMKTFFLGELPAENNIGFFRSLSGMFGKIRASMDYPEQRSGEYSRIIADPYKKLYWDMTIEYGKMYTEMLCEWSRKCEEKLEGYINENSDN